MSANPKRTALARALKYGVPYCHRHGRTIYLVTKVNEMARTGQIAIQEMSSAAQAREFREKAIRESGWKGVA